MRSQYHPRRRSRAPPQPPHPRRDLRPRMPSEANPEPSFGESSCSICLESFSRELKLWKLPCKHVFHEKCIKRHFREQRRCSGKILMIVPATFQPEHLFW